MEVCSKEWGRASRRLTNGLQILRTCRRTSMTPLTDACFKDLGPGGTPCQRRRRVMHGAPFDIGQGRSAVDGIAQYVEHPRMNPLPHRRFQWPARVLHHHAASEPLRGRKRDPAHMIRIALCQHFDDDPAFVSRAQHRANWRQVLIETHIHDTATHRGDRAAVRERWVISGFVHGRAGEPLKRLRATAVPHSSPSGRSSESSPW